MWNDLNNFEAELHEHLDVIQCISAEDLLSKPEHMTAAQECVFNANSDSKSDAENGWIAMYRQLFPGEFPIPSPCEYYLRPVVRVDANAQKIMTTIFLNV